MCVLCVFASALWIVCVLHLHCNVCCMPVVCMWIACVLHLHCMHVVGVFYVFYIWIVCFLHLHCMCVVCLLCAFGLHLHCMSVVCLLCFMCFGGLRPSVKHHIIEQLTDCRVCAVSGFGVDTFRVSVAHT